MNIRATSQCVREDDGDHFSIIEVVAFSEIYFLLFFFFLVDFFLPFEFHPHKLYKPGVLCESYEDVNI